MNGSLHLLRKLSLGAAALSGLLMTGCTSSDVSEPHRTALEQLLLSTAVDNALADVTLNEVSGEKVFLVEDYIESYDKLYVAGSIRALLSENGATLVQDRSEADIIIEARVGALGMDSSKALVGFPSLPVPIPAVGTVETPETALYASDKKDAVAKLALLGYKANGRPLFSTEALSDKAHFHQYRILLLVNLNRTNIPQRITY